MVPIDLPAEFLAMSLPELLKVLAAGKISKEVFDALVVRARKLWDKRRYGFTPDPETARELKNITESDAYNRMKECIGPSGYLNIVRLGLRIEKISYSRPSHEITTFRNEIYERYGREGITILNMGSTGILVPLIEHLSNMKIENNYSQKYIFDYFMDIVSNWKKITIFHRAESGTDDLIKKVTAYMEFQYEIFFVFGIGFAGEQAKKAISTLRNNKTIQKKGYMLELISRETDQMERDHFAWFFKNIYAFDKITLYS